MNPTAVSLFSGAGGLDLGLEAAGFKVLLCVEKDLDCQRTLAANRRPWRIGDPSDIFALAPPELRRQAGVSRREVDLLAGGPPCQPFSKSRYWVNGDAPRLSDPRADTLAAYVAVVEELLPRTILLENVRGLSYEGKDEGLVFLSTELANLNARQGTRYRPVVLHLNAADYGVPQLRERVFVVASRDGSMFIPPERTNAGVAGDGASGLQRYATAWDAIGDLEHFEKGADVELTGKWADLLPSIPEGENYLFHTPHGGGRPLFGWRTRYWSFLLKLAKNRPSWTIQATPGPATGPFHWLNRRLTTRELARLQTFPDDYAFSGDSRSKHRQIGNAVPPALAEVIALDLRRQLLRSTARRERRLAIRLRDDCPPPERRRPVPRKYLNLCGSHADHPGTSRGPGAVKRMPPVEALTPG